MQNKQLHQLSKATQLYGLYLAVQYGSTWDSWLLLAWGELDAEENKELVENAKGRMTQTELADIARIHKSNAKDKQFFQAIISENTSAVKKYRYPYENHEAFKFGLQLAVRRGSIDVGRLLYASTEGSNEESEIYQIGEQAAYERTDYYEHWEMISYIEGNTDPFMYNDFDGACYGGYHGVYYG